MVFRDREARQDSGGRTKGSREDERGEYARRWHRLNAGEGEGARSETFQREEFAACLRPQFASTASVLGPAMLNFWA